MKSPLLSRPEPKIEDFYALKLGSIWAHMKTEHFSFWMICGYLFFEYFRPQSIFKAIDVLPWAQVFILLSFAGRLLDKKAKWVSDPANVWMTLFLFVIVLSSSFAVYPGISWAHFNDIFSWYIIYFLIINIVTSERRFLIFVAIFLIASFKLSFFGARTWVSRGFGFTTWGIQGPPGYFTNSGELSIQMLMFSPVIYYLALFMKPYLSKAKFYFLMLFPITGAMTVLGASSRGAQIALIYQSYRALVKGRISIRTIVVVCAAVWLAFSLIPAEQKARFTSAGDDKTSQQRLFYWKHGLEMIEQNPVLGVGFFNFPAYYQTHYSQDLLYPQAQLPHNIFVQVGTDAGLLGLGIFGMLLYRNAKSARDIRKLGSQEFQRNKPFAALANGLLVALWGFILAGQFVTVTYYPFLWINLALTVALHNIARKAVAA